MEFRIADSLTANLSRLTGGEHRAVKTTAEGGRKMGLIDQTPTFISRRCHLAAADPFKPTIRDPQH